MRIVSLLIAAFLFTITVSAQFSGPKISAKTEVFDFGTKTAGEIVTYSFVIANIGDQPLIIDKVLTSCGCTAAEPAEKTIAPNKSTTIKVEFNTTGREGKQIKYINVVSNDPNDGVHKLTLQGEVAPAPKQPVDGAKLKFEKNQHDFGNATDGDVVSYNFNFENTGTKDLEIRDVRTSCGCTAAVPDKKIYKPGEKGTLKVDLDTKNRPGRLSRTITVMSNDVENEYQVLTVYVEVFPREKK